MFTFRKLELLFDDLGFYVAEMDAAVLLEVGEIGDMLPLTTLPLRSASYSRTIGKGKSEH